MSPVSLLPWWKEWDGRLEFELERFAARGLDVTVVEDPREGASRLVVETEVDLPVEGPTRVVVVFPDGYPHRRFAVYAPSLSLPRHQAPDGNLCVFPRGAQYWHPHFVAADTVADDVPRLVGLVHEGGDALRAEEDPQGEPFTTYYGGNMLGGIVVDERALGLELTDGDHGVMRLGFGSENGDWLLGVPEEITGWQPTIGQGFLVSVATGSGVSLTADPDEHFQARYPVGLDGRWLYLDEPPKVNTPQELWHAVIGAQPSLASWAASEVGMQVLGLCVREEIQQDVFGLAWVFLARTSEQVKNAKGRRSGNPGAARPGRKVSRTSIVRGLRYVPSDLGVRIPELEPLRDRTVSVVGLGSLGGPFVQELTKGRVGLLRLSDHDFVDPATSVRYPLGLESAGIDKALALSRWVTMHNPEVDVEVINRMYGTVGLEDTQTQSEQKTLEGLLSGADLFVSATAEPDVNRQLDLAALRLGVPRLFMWSQSGYGGVVALLRAGRTGCFHCLSLYLSKKSEAGEHVVEVPPVDENGQEPGTVQGPGCGDKTFTANHADLLPISVQAARVAYGVMCGGDGGYPEFGDDVFAVQLRKPDGQPIPPQWDSFGLPPDRDCPTCHPAP